MMLFVVFLVGGVVLFFLSAVQVRHWRENTGDKLIACNHHASIA